MRAPKGTQDPLNSSRHGAPWPQREEGVSSLVPLVLRGLRTGGRRQGGWESDGGVPRHCFSFGANRRKAMDGFVLASCSSRHHPQTAVMGFGRLTPTSSPPLHRGSPARGLEWSSEQLRHPQSWGHQKAPTWLVTAALLVLAQALATQLTKRTKEQGAVPRRPSQHGPGPGGGQC